MPRPIILVDETPTPAEPQLDGPWVIEMLAGSDGPLAQRHFIIDYDDKSPSQYSGSVEDYEAVHVFRSRAEAQAHMNMVAGRFPHREYVVIPLAEGDPELLRRLLP